MTSDRDFVASITSDYDMIQRQADTIRDMAIEASDAIHSAWHEGYAAAFEVMGVTDTSVALPNGRDFRQEDAFKGSTAKTDCKRMEEYDD